MSWVSSLVTAITSSFTTLSEGIVNLLTTTFTGLFLTTNESGAVTGVSNFGIFAFVLMGISLCMGLVYYIVNMVRRKM